MVEKSGRKDGEERRPGDATPARGGDRDATCIKTLHVSSPCSRRHSSQATDEISFVINRQALDQELATGARVHGHLTEECANTSAEGFSTNPVTSLVAF